jgi:hypothetical protein
MHSASARSNASFAIARYRAATLRYESPRNLLRVLGQIVVPEHQIPVAFGLVRAIQHSSAQSVAAGCSRGSSRGGDANVTPTAPNDYVRGRDNSDLSGSPRQPLQYPRDLRRMPDPSFVERLSDAIQAR